MPRTLEMIFDAKIKNGGDLDKLENTIESVAQQAGITAERLSVFNQILTQTAQRTGSYTEAVRQLAGQSNLFQQFAKGIQDQLKTQQKAADDAAKAAKKAADEFEKAKAREAAAAKKAADEIIKQRERIQSALGRVGARIGGQAIGSAAGIPGLGYAGGSLLGSLGLSGGAMMGIGGVATGIFAGVEFAKSLDQLAKWAQEQQNAARETGITVTEMEQLSRVSDRTGVSLTGAAKSVQDLSKEMVEGGSRARQIQSALSEIGLGSRVAFEEPYDGLIQIQKALVGIKDPAERDRVAIELLGEAAGRAAAATAGVAKSGNIIDAGTMKELAQAREQMSEIGEQWDILKSKFATPLKATLQVVNGIFSMSFDQGTAPSSVSTGAVGSAAFEKKRSGFLPGIVPTFEDLSAATAADRAAQVNAHAQSWISSHGTPEDRYKAEMDSIDLDRQKLMDSVRAGTISAPEFDRQMAQIEARKNDADVQRRSGNEYRSQMESWQQQFGGNSWRNRIPSDSSDTFREYADLSRRYNLLSGYEPYENWMGQLRSNLPGASSTLAREMLNRQFPGLSVGDYSKMYMPLTREDEEFQRGLERQNRDAEQSQEQMRKDQRQRLDDINAQARDQTEDAEAALRLRAAIMSGTRGALARSGGLTPAGIAQLDFNDQMKMIQQSYLARALPLSGAISSQTGELSLAVNQDDREAIQRSMDNERAQLQKLQNDSLTQSVEALDKFNQSIQETSDKIRDEFGNFAEGLFNAGLHGKAGSYSRSFLIGQAGRVVSNFGKSIYEQIPGILSFPGQGTPDSPTFMGRMLQGTIFQQDPKAQGVSMDANTTATEANTTATLALVAAMGVDPQSLGITGSSGITMPSLGSLTANAEPGSLIGQVQNIAKGLGVTIPGISSRATPARSGGGLQSIFSGNPATAALMKLFQKNNGWTAADLAAVGGLGEIGDSWTASDLSAVGGLGEMGDSDDLLSYPGGAITGGDDGTSLSFPALGIGAGANSSDNFTDQLSDSIGSAFSSQQVSDQVGSSFAKAVANQSTTGDLTNSQNSTVGSALSQILKATQPIPGANSANTNPLAANSDLSMGVQSAAAGFSMYSGISEMTHGGAQNISGGLGKTLLGASSVLSMIPGADVAAPFVALAGGLSDLVSAFMGDPRANRQKQLTEEEIANTYTAPNPLNVTTNANGMMTTTDYRGQVESLDALPSVSSVNAILGFNPYNTSQLISSQQWELTPSGMVPPAQKSAPAQTVISPNINISAMDAKSIMDRGSDIADALVPVLQGTHRINSDIQRVATSS